MRIAELFETTAAALAKPELIDWQNHQVAVNPTPGMLRKMLRNDRYHEVRIITLGNDIATCPSWGIIHQDMGSALAHQSHPAWSNRNPLWYMGDGCWFLNVHPEGAVVNDKQGRIVPPEEWPPALKRALAGTPIMEARHPSPTTPLWQTPEFKAWFGQSKAVDATGRPQIFYHGSAQVFDRFDVGKAGSGAGGVGEKAIFLSWDRETANGYAATMGAGYGENPQTHTTGVVYPVYVRAERPYISKMTAYNSAAMARDISKAKRLRYDSIFFPHITYTGENGTIAVFSANQIKSAIGNQRFDPDRPGMTEAAAESQICDAT